MSLVKLLFYLMSFIALASGLYVASTKNLVRSIFMFFITLFAVAGLYVLALADFVAITQIVIYVGGILVLMLFAFKSLIILSGLGKLSLSHSKFPIVPLMVFPNLYKSSIIASTGILLS